MKFNRTVFLSIQLVITLLLSSTLYAQETESSLKSKAEKAYKDGAFVDASTLYSQLLAFNAADPFYNYRYGVCLIYNSRKKEGAIKHLMHASKQEDFDIEVFYYLGRAYHLNYEFEEAIRYYEKYKEKAGSKSNPDLEVDRQIQMSENGKRLFSSMNEMIVLEKKEIENESFFRIYDLKDIGGDLIVNAQFQSKTDKKREHVPLIHFPARPKMIFYSSYGDDDKNGKDIFIRRKLPDGTWSLPQTVNGGVNTPFDEDFPYLHPNGKHLYFCSKGHNSMGGYDVFRSTYNQESNSFGVAENLDFAISSPDNDLFYVVDSLDKYAYFASSRQSKDGKIHVYKLRVERLPDQLAVVKAQFNSDINPANKKVTVEIYDHLTKNKLGTFNSNTKGYVIITFPKGGKYEYEIAVDGGDIITKSIVSIPFLSEFKPLKQRLIHEQPGGTEQVRIVNLFDEDVEDPIATMREIALAKSELNPNADKFDLDKLDAKAENREIYAELGMEKLSDKEIQETVQKLAEKGIKQIEEVRKISQKSVDIALQDIDKLQQLQNQLKSKVAEADSKTGAEKKALYKEAGQLVNAINTLDEKVKKSLFLADSLSDVASNSTSKNQKIVALSKEVEAVFQKGDVAAMAQLISANKEQLKEIREQSGDLVNEKIIGEIVAIRDELKKEKAQQKEYLDTKVALKQEILNLEVEHYDAKTKDKPDLKRKWDAKLEELKLVEEELKSIESKIAGIAQKETVKQAELAVFQDIQNSSIPVSTKSSKDALQSLNEANTQNNRTLAAYVEEQNKEMGVDLAELPVSQVPEKKEAKTNTGLTGITETKQLRTPDAKQEKAIDELSVDYAKNVANIQQDENLDEEQKLKYLQRQDKDVKFLTAKVIAKTNEQLSLDPSNNDLKTKLQELESLNSLLSNNIVAREQELSKKFPETNPPRMLSESQMIQRIKPHHLALMLSIEQDSELSNNERLDKAQTEDQALIGLLLQEKQKLEEALAQTPNDQKLKHEYALVDKIVKDTEDRIGKRTMGMASFSITDQGSDENAFDPNAYDKKKGIEDPNGDLTTKQNGNGTDPNTQGGTDKNGTNTNGNTDPKGDLTTKQNGTGTDPNSKQGTDKNGTNANGNIDPKGDLTTKQNGNGTDPNSKQGTDKNGTNANGKIDSKGDLTTKQNGNGTDPNSKQGTDKNGTNTNGNIDPKGDLTTKQNGNGTDPNSKQGTDKNGTNANGKIDPKGDLTTKQNGNGTDPNSKQGTDKNGTNTNGNIDPKGDLTTKQNGNGTDPNSKQGTDKNGTNTNGNTDPKADQLASNVLDAESEKVIRSIRPSYSQEIAEINENKSLSPLDKQKALIVEENNLQVSLTQRLKAIDLNLANDPLSPELLAEKKQLLYMQEASISREEEAKQLLLNEEIKNIKQDKLLAKVNQKYVRDMAKLASKEDEKSVKKKLVLEEQLQTSIAKRIAANQLELEKNEDLSLQAENKVLNDLLDESQNRVMDRKASQLTQTPEMEALRKELLGESSTLVTKEAKDLTELKAQDSLLAVYEEKLQVQAKQIDQELQANPNDKQWIAAQETNAKEQEYVKIKRYQVGVSIGEMEQRILAATSGDPNKKGQNSSNLGQQESELQVLNQQEAAILSKLADSKGSKKETKELQSELAEVQTKQVEQKDQVLNTQEQALESIQQSAPKNNTSPAARAIGAVDSLNYVTYQSNDKELKSDQEKLIKTKKVKKQLPILERIDEKQDQNSALATELVYNKQLQKDAESLSGKPNETSPYDLESKVDLEKRKYRAGVEIGALETELLATEEMVKKAKVKDKVAILKGIEPKIARLEVLKDEQLQIDKALNARKNEEIDLEPKIIAEIDIQPDLENEITSKKNYEELKTAFDQKQGSLEELALKYKTVEEKKKQYTEALALYSANPTPERKQELAQRLNEVKQSEEAYQASKRQSAADQQVYNELMADESNILPQLESLFVRGVSSSSRIPELITKNNHSIDFDYDFKILDVPLTNPAKERIPIGQKMPMGLVYRVQVGAFRNPLKSDLFSEFTPVTGEQINSGITRYITGYFPSLTVANGARSRIRNIGYSDAFVVAYCDGKRISIAEAKRLEAKGECVPDPNMRNVEPLAVENPVSKEVPVSKTENQTLKTEKKGTPTGGNPVSNGKVDTKTEEVESTKGQPRRTKLVIQDDGTVIEQAVGTISETKVSTKSSSSPLSDYNKAPGAVEAIAVETKQGLFFTVQIGAYSKPIDATRLKYSENIVSKKLDDGKIRYSTGIFPSIEACMPTKAKVIAAGIGDAFVTAYYKGDRISIAEATRLLEANGSGILEKSE